VKVWTVFAEFAQGVLASVPGGASDFVYIVNKVCSFPLLPLFGLVYQVKRLSIVRTYPLQ
jgi:hypothetical protein